MATEWYYAKNKQKVGPVTEAQLQELVRTGELSPADMVWKQGMAKWQPAGAVDGLLPVVPSAAVPPPLPNVDRPLMLVWQKVYKNKPAFFGGAFGIAIILGPVVSKIFSIFPDGFASFLHLMYALFVIGLFVALVVTGMSALHRAAMRGERLKNLWGKWEPVSGQGCSLWFYQDGGFLRNDGFGAKYVYDLDQDIIRVNVEGFGQAIPLKVITITKHELVVDGGNQALHFKKGKTITDERWEASVEKTKEFLKQAALVTGVVAVGAVAVGALVLGAAAVAAGGVVAAGAAGSGSYGGGNSGGGALPSEPKEKPYRQVPCTTCNQKGWLTSGPAKGDTCLSCGGKGYILMQ